MKRAIVANCMAGLGVTLFEAQRRGNKGFEKLIQVQMEKRLLTIHLPSLGALPGGPAAAGKGARPTFRTGSCR